MAALVELAIWNSWAWKEQQEGDYMDIRFYGRRWYGGALVGGLMDS